jgi:hypothetical protein
MSIVGVCCGHSQRKGIDEVARSVVGAGPAASPPVSPPGTFA